MKRAFGTVEMVLDVFYLGAGALIALLLLFSSSGNYPRFLAGLAALVLAGGDAFHLLPRINLIKTGQETALRRRLGRGKQIASITMTVFYLFLWQIGLLLHTPEDIYPWSFSVYGLAALRILLCLLPQNRWQERYPPLLWGVWRNIPFFLQGALVAGLYFTLAGSRPGFDLFWLAISLSFAFYLPVVLWANKYPKVGILMLPKTYLYLWMLVMFKAF